MPRPPKTQLPQQPVQQVHMKFNRMGQIKYANRVLESLGSPTRIGNLMNPALRQSTYDTRNLDRIDSDTE